MFPVLSFLLALVTLGVLVIVLFRNKKNTLYSPALILSMMLFLFSLFSLIYLGIKKSDITIATLCCFSGIDIVFLLFDIFYTKIFKRKKVEQSSKANNKALIFSHIDINFIVIIVLALIFAGATFWQFRDIYTQIKEHGYTNITTLKQFYYAMRNIYTSNFTGFKFNFFCTQLLNMQKAFIYILVFVLIHNVVFYGFKLKHLLLLIPFPSYFVAMFLTSGRTEMLMFMFYIGLLLFFAYSISLQKASLIDRAIKIMGTLMVIIIGVTIFYWIYRLTTPNKASNILDYFYHYSAGAIYNFGKLTSGEVEYTKRLTQTKSNYTIIQK